MIRSLNVSMILFLLAAAPTVAQSTLHGVLGGAAANADDGGAFVEIDQATGTVTPIGTPLPGRGLTGVAVDSAGRVFATSDVLGPNGAELIEIDPATGALVNVIGSLTRMGVPVAMHDIAIQPGTDIIFGSAVLAGNLALNDLVTIDRDTAVVTRVGNPGFIVPAVAAIGFAPNGALWSKIANSGEYWTLDPATAAILTSGTTTVGGLGFAIRPDGQMILAECCGVTLGNDIYSLDTGSGVATFLGPAGGTRRVHDMVFIDSTSILEIPTLGTLAFWVLTLGLAMAAVLRLRRQDTDRFSARR